MGIYKFLGSFQFQQQLSQSKSVKNAAFVQHQLRVSAHIETEFVELANGLHFFGREMSECVLVRLFQSCQSLSVSFRFILMGFVVKLDSFQCGCVQELTVRLRHAHMRLPPLLSKCSNTIGKRNRRCKSLLRRFQV